jgi:hypothetical protein
MPKLRSTFLAELQTYTRFTLELNRYNEYDNELGRLEKEVLMWSV